MSWSRPLRRTLLFSHLENLHHTSHPSRSVHRALCTSYCTHGAGRGDEHNFRRTISGLATRHGMRTGFWRSSSLLWPPNTDTVGRSFLLGMQRHYATQSPTETKSRKMLYYLTALVFGMVGLTYAAVPLYRTFCQATGYGGTVQRKESVEEKIARHADAGTVTQREIVVQFNADVADGMPWKFVPTQREVRVKPGESALAFYTAENRSSAPITGVSTYNVTPMKAGVYFNKIQCFCFEEQRLLPGEQIDMPVFFYIDPEFETDPRMDGINNLILSYTFFKVSEESSDTAKNSPVAVQGTNEN